jgi:hypothetical protein
MIAVVDTVSRSIQDQARTTAELEKLGDEIAELAAHLHAATYRLLVMLREFDGRGGWWCGGFRSCAHWLSWRTGIGLGAAREKMRVARALAQLPQSSEAMRALLERALAAAAEVLYGQRQAADPGDRHTADVEQASAAQRRADAIGLIAECALRSDLAANTEPAEGEGELRAQRDLQERRRGASAVGRADRFQVVVHVDAEALCDSSDSGQSVIADGVRVSAETSRRLACDASRVVMTHDSEGHVIGVGRRTRTVPPAIRRALEHRPCTCRTCTAFSWFCLRL